MYFEHLFHSQKLKKKKEKKKGGGGGGGGGGGVIEYDQNFLQAD